VLLLGAAGLTGCKATHVSYVHEASLGVNLNLAAEGTAKLNVGYDRETFALVPRYTPEEPSSGASEPQGEAMSVTAVSRVYLEGMSRVYFGHAVATGRPAIWVAKDGKGLKEITDRIFGDIPAPGVKKKPEAPTP
jgi:hypothetical protein